MKRQPTWDKYEVALLVDAYIRITKNGEQKKCVLQELSQKLRLKAINEGLVIDDTFRNLNGMMWQIGFVDCAFKNTGYGRHLPPKMFRSIVDLYKNDNVEFEKLYEQAVTRTINKDDLIEAGEVLQTSMNKKKFVDWIKKKSDVDYSIELICSIFENCSSYAVAHGILNAKIWDIDDELVAQSFFEKLERDRNFNVVHTEDAKLIKKMSSLYLDFLKNAHATILKSESIEDNIEKVLSIVSNKYVYGYRLGSVIERMKLHECLLEADISFDGDDEALEQMLIENGYVSNGKVFINSDDQQEKIDYAVKAVFDSGVNVIYYDQFYEKNIELMNEVYIASEESLKDILKKKYKELTYSKNFFTNQERITEDAAVSQEIIRVWGSNTLVSVDEFENRLPFIPREKIKFYLSMSPLFVWVSEGVYTRVETIIVSELEKETIQRYVGDEIERKGYISLSDLPLGDIVEENYELSEYAIFTGIFSKCLAHKYCLNGRIVTRKNAEFDATTLMKQYCSEQKNLTLDEAISKVEEFTGVGDRRVAYPVLYDVMVRVGDQQFVSDEQLHFDVDKIDQVIDQFVIDGFVSIKGVTTFALFPECGQPWNHYLLESYCYRFSYKYSYRTNLFNGRNAGAIVDASINWNYQELMARAVARSSIKLEPNEVGRYLYESGYMARRKFSSLKEIAERAKILREGK